MQPEAMVSSGPPAAEAISFDLICVARLVPVKGYPLLLDSFARLQQLRPGTSLAIVGGGPFETEYRQTVADYGLTEYVHFIGKVPEVEPYLRRSRLFVLFSENEGLSIAMLEAMALGVPVYVTNVGDLADPIATEPPGGWLVEDQDPAAIAEELAEILEQDLTHVGQIAQRTIATHYSVVAISERWTQLFKQF